MQLVQDDPTPKNMANRDNGDDKNGRRNQKFNIDNKAFESDDDFDNFDFSTDEDNTFALSMQVKKRSKVILIFIIRHKYNK